jgi:catechol 2,3-dioxygenase-like lactoylglutathione lyase family enzyme
VYKLGLYIYIVLRGGFNMIPQRVHVITIGVKNLPNLRAFYQRLGWKEVKQSSDEHAVFKNEDTLFSLYPFKELAEDAQVDFIDIDGYKPITYAICVEKPDDVDETIKLAEKAGAKILKPATKAFWGGRSGYFADPEKNVWEIAWNPFARFDERGTMTSMFGDE